MKKKHLRVLWASAIAILAIVFVFFSACGIFSSDDDDDDEEKDSGSSSVTVETGEVEGVTLSKSSVTIYEDEEINLLATVAMTYGEFGGNYYWSSSNPIVANFLSGVYSPEVAIYGYKAGTSTVTVSAGGMSATCEITVIPVPEPVVVENEEEFEAALEDGGYIELASDMEGTFEVTEETVIDLSGNTLTAGGDSSENNVTVGEGASLIITDSGEGGKITNGYKTETGTSGTSTDNAAAVYVEKGTLVMDGGTVESSSIGIKAEDGANVTINGGTIDSGYFALWLGGDGTTVTINDGTISGTDKGIVLCGDGSYGHDEYQTGAVQELSVNGGTLSCEKDSVICTLGSTNASSSIVNVTGGTLTGADVYDETTKVGTPFPTIYMACGTLSISGDAVISGSTPVEVRGGTTTISGGSLICTAAGYSSHENNSSGATSYGYVLSVFPYGSGVKSNGVEVNNEVAVSVTGGTFSGAIYASVEEDYTDAKYAWRDYSFEIFGGTFDTEPSGFVAEGYETVAGETGFWVVAEKAETDPD